MDKPERIVARAEGHLWDYLKRQLEAEGNGETAGQLRHFLLARAGEPVVRGGLALVAFEMFHRVSDYSIQLNANTGEVMAWYFDLLEAGPGKKLGRAEALAAAVREAGLPAGAVLESAAYEDAGDEPAFVARWGHEEGGIPVEKDFIQVQLNGNTGHTFALNRRWHAVDPTPSER